MRSSVIISIVALSTAVPSLAAPVVSGPQYTKRQSSSFQSKRDSDESGVFAPFLGPPRFNGPPRFTLPYFPNHRLSVARADDESAAINWGSILKWAPTVISTVASFFKREDIEDLLARGYDENVAREFEYHLSRELTARDVESGAFPWGAIFKAAPSIISAASGIYNLFKGKREFEEFFARELGVEFTRELAARGGDESGAFPWGAVLKWAPTVISAVSSFFNKRDVEELLARGYDEHLAREFEEHLTREIFTRDDLQSGAFPWAAVFKAAPSIITAANSIYSIFKGKRELEGLQAREFEELLTRELGEQFARSLVARDDDQSGAFWGALFRAAPTIISAISGLFHKREFEELLTRSVLESRSLSELD